MTGPEAYRLSKRMDAENAGKAVLAAKANGCPVLAGYMLGLLRGGRADAVLHIEREAMKALEQWVR